MDPYYLDISKTLQQICKINTECRKRLQKYFSREIWNPKDREELLESLSELYLKHECTEDISHCFSSVILDILERNKKRVKDGFTVNNNTVHTFFFVALSKSLHVTADVVHFAADYLKTFPRVYPECAEADEPQPKKARKEKKHVSTNREILCAVYKFLQYLGAELKYLWDWSIFVTLAEDGDPQTRWLILHILSLVTGITPTQLDQAKKKYFTDEEAIQLTLQYRQYDTNSLNLARLITAPQQKITLQNTERMTHTVKGLLEMDLTAHVIPVAGVLLPVFSSLKEQCSTSLIKKKVMSDALISVPTTKDTLQNIALAVANGSPVLLEGPVGCGKTSLVEHLAKVTGRDRSPLLIKIQFGEQTDSKSLIGTYICTEVPGEFVWQPGNLTKAVTEGHWILLEDLDYAPMDVISVLVPLLENGTLLVSGHGDVIKASSNFRVFATRRLVSSGGSLFKQHSAGLEILEKLWNKIIVKPLSDVELKQVIVSKHPLLETVVDKLVEIYLLLADGKHPLTYKEESGSKSEIEEVAKFLSHEGRPISTRDLMKWISRVSAEFDKKSGDIGNVVFQDALDCFCACISKKEKQCELAEAIASKLNISKAKAEFYIYKYKPSVDITVSDFKVGRISLQRQPFQMLPVQRGKSSFAFTSQSVRVLERVAICISKSEPVLLVGETGVGKTSSIQYLAEQIGKPLRVINMNQQSDSTDLIGGYKPVDMRFVVAPFKEEFELTFCETFSRKQNTKFLSHIQNCFSKRRWFDLFALMETTQKAGIKKVEHESDQYQKWIWVGRKLQNLKSQVKQKESALAFTFIEGTLIRALKNGDWVLLDEINLASFETLECLSGLLESSSGSVILNEKGDSSPVMRHPEFRLFACMNPATDVGKKDLPLGIRNRFTEFFIEELDDSQELKVLVAEYLKGLSLTGDQIDNIVTFYQVIKLQSVKHLTDGTGRKPHFSLRTLCRALNVAASNSYGNVLRSLYEAFCLSFLTQLDRSSHPLVEKQIREYVVGKGNFKGLLKQAVSNPQEGEYLKFEGYWLHKGSGEPEVPEGYVLTPSVRANLKDVARVVSVGKFPVLIQGETSVGKTSLVTWLAKSTGNKCMRINNHEHTDLQEYIGCYTADHTGKLIFQEGVLVQAMRKGYWIILDELNLAPTDVLEALNRLLDDNRELFIAETQETVKAHAKFMLFATQNPPGLYGGRKVLSRAFRNRFIELHFDEIPPGELETILHESCQLPMSYCRKLVAVLLDLQTRRKGSGVFAGKQGFITLRDLFRWAERYRMASNEFQEKFFDWDQLLADNGYMLLAGRVRNSDECVIIKEIIQKHLKRNVDPFKLFSLHDSTSHTTTDILNRLLHGSSIEYEHVVWTESMRRMAVLVGQALKFGEPVLLVGETGCGKTTVCQLLAALKEQRLYSVNCHMHTESADFLGGLRPVRHRHEGTDDQRLFEWCDGPLVMAMKEGNMFLIDEISLADDSVLERLNSVLELEKTLLLAEKGGSGDLNQVEQIVASSTFRVLATMNPGGDYGKKELSPALRNRFTEIWCPLNQKTEDLVEIIEHNLNSGILLHNQEDGTSGFGKAMIEFVEWFSNNEIGKRVTVSIRDLLSWTQFINQTAITVHEEIQKNVTRLNQLEPAVAYIHGACLVFLDALGSSSTDVISMKAASKLSINYLIKQMEQITGQNLTDEDLGFDTTSIVYTTDNDFGIGRFCIVKGERQNNIVENYTLEAPTTGLNAHRVLRALQLRKPILLEGSPGVGKTSLVAAIAKAAGHELIRINLSEQTDVSDLFGADLPVEGGKGGEFSWRDGPLLQALKAGHWIVLDELNLASQSVLEGLNACLDHRAEVYIPELDKTFLVQHEKTKLFACQNPLNQGGGRKGLPQSFLNRFTQVYVDALSKEDLLFITHNMFPQIPDVILDKMICFNQKVNEKTMFHKNWGQKGSPWEFNLRDLFRWANLMIAYQEEGFNPAEYVNLVYMDRMRTVHDKSQMADTFKSVFGCDNTPVLFKGEFSISQEIVQVGHSLLERCVGTDSSCPTKKKKSLQLLRRVLPYMESLMKCIEMNWMAILIGSSGCGKTSLVHLLAELSGHVLDILPMNSAMDTTELLGGYEQVDLKRHLEDLERKTNNVVNDLVRKVITTKAVGKTNIASILHCWYKCKNMDFKGDCLSSKEEVAIMKDKVRMIQHLLQLIRNCLSCVSITPFWHGIFEIIPKYEKTLQKLSIQLDTQQSTNQGGMFEWVDSVLVKALKEGHWLLIENVNFCSASVLDRLNELLEPGGVLTMNERGVIGDGIPTVKPHPNFRLIMTMNPLYGEISRAMRNRGIEIYMLGENDGVPYSDQDLKMLLHSCGLVGKIPCETVMQVHRNIEQSDLRMKCSISDMLRVAEFTHQQLQRGNDLKTSLQWSCNEVYMSNYVGDQQRKVIKNIIDEVLCTFDLRKWEEENGTSSLLDVALWPNCLPAIEDWCQSVTVANMQQNAVLFNHLINIWSLKLSNSSNVLLSYSELEQCKKSKLSEVKTTQDLMQELPVVIKVVFESCSVHTLPYCLQFLLQSVHRNLGSEFKVGNKLTVGNELEALGNNLTEVLKKTFEGVYKHSQSRTLCALIADEDILCEQPFDLRWCPQFWKFVRHKLKKSDEEWLQIFNIVNQLYLENRLIINQIIHQDGLQGTEINFSKSKKEDLSPLQISYGLSTGTLSYEQPIHHQSFLHLYTFVKLLDEALLNNNTTYTGLSDSHFIQVITDLSWYERFLQQCRLPLREHYNMVPTLCLHWNWLYNKTLLPLNHRFSFPEELTNVINKLKSLLGIECAASQLFKTLWTSVGHPLPYSGEDKAIYIVKILDICHKLSVRSNHAMKKPGYNKKILMWYKRGCDFKVVMSEALSKLREHNDDSQENLDEILGKMQAFVEELYIDYNISELQSFIPAQIAVTSEDNLSPKIDHDYENTKIAMWPLIELELMWTQTCLLGKVLEHTTNDTELLVKTWIEYQYSQAFVEPQVLEPWIEFLQSQEKVSYLKKEHSNLVLNTMQRLTSNLLLKNPEHWLLWTMQDDSEVTSSFDRKSSSVETICSAAFSKYVFTLLTGEDVQVTQDDKLLPRSIRLGEVDEKMTQLEFLTLNLSRHLGLITSSHWSMRINLLRIMTSLFQHLLSSCVLLLPENQRSKATDAVLLLSSPIEKDLPNAVKSLKEIFSIDDFKPLLPEFSKIISLSLETFHICAALKETDRTNGSKNEFASIISIGKLMVLVGSLYTFLLAPQGPVDPAQEVQMKLEYSKHELESIETEHSVRNTNHQIQTGMDITFDHPEELHPHMQDQLSRKQYLIKKVQEYASQKAVRASTSQFDSILQETKQYCYINSVTKVKMMLEKLETLYANLVSGKRSNLQILNEIQNWNNSIEEVLTRLQCKYPLYRDLLVPFMSGIVQTRVGFEMARCAIKMLSERVLLFNQCIVQQTKQTTVVHTDYWLEDTVSLFRFPFITEKTQNSLKLVESLISNQCIGVVRSLVKSMVRNDDYSEGEAEDCTLAVNISTIKSTSRILQSCLCLLSTHTCLTGILKSDTLDALFSVLSLYVASWQQQEDERQIKEIEEQSLYKYREQVHGEELKEEEKDERARKYMFPTYDEDFEDIKIGYTMVEKTKGSDQETCNDPNSRSKENLLLETSENEIANLSKVHNSIFTNLTTTRWFNRTQTWDEECDLNYVLPVVNGYLVAATIMKHHAKNILQDIDGCLIGAHLVFSSVLQNTANPLDSVFQKQECKPYDIYYDSNVPEVMKCRPLLEQFRIRVEELLKEWADHPTLKELLVIIDRVMLFPVTGPLMKFTTGIEILLQKAQEWERNAAKYVSLKNQMDNCTQMIIQWRKLELQCWKTCLDGVVYKSEQKAHKWWFHLYQLISSCFDKKYEGVAAENTEIFASKDTMKTLQRFMETSTLGDFKVRLNLLHGFLLQLVHMKISPQQEKLVHIMWNVHTFYKYYVHNVEEEIAKLRTPIEKELKNFVKIARWNDINFYAMKQAVEKTHKTLHKHIKEFEKVLQLPVQQALVDSGYEWTQQSHDINAFELVNRVKVDMYLHKLEHPKILKVELKEDSILHKLPSLSKKTVQHTSNILKMLRMEHQVHCIDVFTGELIDSVHELQNLQVNRTVDKDKQKSEAKHMQQRKRKALADLFKCLQNLGLSYKKGLMYLQNPQFEDRLLQPLDISAAISHKKDGLCFTDEADKIILDCWQGCEKYQMRCLSRAALFLSSLNSPSKELGPNNIERLKGFSAHLSSLLTVEWNSLADVWDTFVDLKENVEELQSFEKNKMVICRDKAETHIVLLKECSEEVIEFLSQLKILLQSFPKRLVKSAISPLPANAAAELLASCQDDEKWQIVFDRVQNAVKQLLSKKKIIDEIYSKKSRWLSSSDIQACTDFCNNLSQVKCTVLNFIRAFLLMSETEENNCITLSMSFVERRIDETEKKFTYWVQNIKSSHLQSQEKDFDSIRTTMESAMTQIMLGVQNLVKVNKDAGSEDTKEETEMLNKHLTVHVIQRIKDNIQSSRLIKVRSATELLLASLSMANLCTEQNIIRQLLHEFIPMVVQYMLLLQYFITQAVASVRSSAKLLSVLLGVFTELVQKGFCLPAEYSDEVEGEGATEFKDIEGGGLGDGEGVKDVSDQIESEDQLDEAQKSSEEKDETTQQPDVKPEDNAIEMSDDFEGNMQDLEAKQDGDESDQENENETEELDKQMGDVEGMGETDKLDEQIWGSDEENDENETQDEFGTGNEEERESELVAKEDNPDQQQQHPHKNEEHEKDSKKEDEEDHDDTKLNELAQADEREYDENEVDPYQNEERENKQDPQDIELPENIDLDNDEEELNSNDKDDNQVDDNQFDIDKMLDEDEAQSNGENPEKNPDENDDIAPEEENENTEEQRHSEGNPENMEVDESTEDENIENQHQEIEANYENEDHASQEDENKKDIPQVSEHSGKSTHDTQEVQQADDASNTAGQNENEEQEKSGVGTSESLDEGHHSDKQSSVTKGGDIEKQQKVNRKPGKSEQDRTLGSMEEKIQKRLKTMDNTTTENNQEGEKEEVKKSDIYEHTKESQYDAQTTDAATIEQQQQSEARYMDQSDDDSICDNEDTDLMDENHDEAKENVEQISSAKLKSMSDKMEKNEKEEKMDTSEEQDEVLFSAEGTKIATHGVARGDTSIYTALEYLNLDSKELDIEKLRHELENDLQMWNISKEEKADSYETQVKATEVWQKYEAITASLSQELCEQLRLILEPSLASKLSGDYRTGKRLNMRKVIPYIASQFRKDKIWLRRTKPSKRNYQILMAIDDSSSMADNHSKQLAFESLATIANALVLLEVGELSICSFGETVKVLHPFHEQFTNHSGAAILQQFTFEQKKTKIAQLLQRITALMLNARAQQAGQVTNIETSQLLLIVSDGRGLFLEGMDVVKSAVRQARESNIFVVFVILDNPMNKDSILDIRVPLFKGPGQLPEIKSYMDHFPFPFYMILRDVNALPTTLSDALRQWFELVTGGDR